jgi:putative ABC transport system substrate-binding protein
LLASEIVDANPDVIVAVTSPSILAAKKATQSIPIVMAIAADPLGSGFVKSLARPEANITGPSLMLTELTPKRVQLLKELIPELSHLGILWNQNTTTSVAQAKLAEQAASPLGVSVRLLGVKTFTDLTAAFDKAIEDRLNAILVAVDPFLFDRRAEIIALSQAKRIPTFHTFPEEALDGAVAAYGASLAHEYRRSALYVDKILKGAAPADLPVDQAARFEFVLNIRTAKVIGLSIPDSIILRADKVIE